MAAGAGPIKFSSEFSARIRFVFGYVSRQLGSGLQVERMLALHHGKDRIVQIGLVGHLPVAKQRVDGNPRPM
ncbi:hypothetical protein ACVWWP_000552 [Bradyrhizobium sp. LM3.6]